MLMKLKEKLAIVIVIASIVILSGLTLLAEATINKPFLGFIIGALVMIVFVELITRTYAKRL